MLDAYPDWQIPAHVITMVPTADRQKATVLVRIGFKQLDPRILPDMGVKVTFLARRTRRRTTPTARSAGHARARRPPSGPTTGQTSLFVVRSDGASSAGRSDAAAPTAIGSRCVGGPAAGERVVVAAAGRALKVGERVAVIRSEPMSGSAAVSDATGSSRDVHKNFTRGSERIDVLKGVNLESRRAISSR